MTNLVEEKELAMQSAPSPEDHNERYDVADEEIKAFNERMVSISNLRPHEVREANGIKTKKRTGRQYNSIWCAFIKDHAAKFTSYMGYGVADIKKIGHREFIDFMDWRVISDIGRYRYDKVKVIPCQHCKSKFTTFQLDLGLCTDCKKEFDLDKFGEACAASDEKDPGSSGGLVVMFTYFEEFRNMYSMNITFEEKVKMCVEHDDLRGAYTRDILLSIVGNDDAEYLFVDTCNSVPMIESTANRYVSIRNILESDDDIEGRTARMKAIF